MSAKEAIDDKLQGSVATHLKCGGVVNKQIKKGLLLSLSVKIFLNRWIIWQNYKQERGCLMHFLRLLEVRWPGAQSKQDNHVPACNFAKCLPILRLRFDWFMVLSLCPHFFAPPCIWYSTSHCLVTSHPGQLNLLPHARWEMSKPYLPMSGEALQ